MMTFPVDLDLLRKNPNLFKECFRKRGVDPGVVDEALELDKKRIELQKIIDSLRHRKNAISRAFGIIRQIEEGKIDKEEGYKKIKELGIDIIEKERLKREIEELEKELKQKEKEYNKTLNDLIKTLWNFPNLISDEVPIGDESKNTPVRFWGIPRVWKNHLELFRDQTEKWGWKIIELKEFLEKDEYKRYIKDIEKLKEIYNILKGNKEFIEINFNEVLDFELLNKDKIVPYVLIEWEPKHHYDLIKEFNIADTDKAGEVAGSRFYFEFNDLVLLDLGLGLEGLRFLIEKGYKPTIPPYMLKKQVLDGIITLDDYEDMMYKIEGEGLYLIGTAEHPITALYYNHIFEENELPLRVTGWSPCFRKEAGAHGKDTKGIFRVHQFHKVEQYIFCKPEESEKMHQELIKNAEEFMQKLNLPYRVVLIASEDMGKRNYKQYDLEGWFPGQGKYRELVSGSNVTDWQARRGNIRYRKKDNKLEFVHTLNCTLVAHQRTLCCIMENFYDHRRDCIVIPKVLQKYIDKAYISK